MKKTRLRPSKTKSLAVLYTGIHFEIAVLHYKNNIYIIINIYDHYYYIFVIHRTTISIIPRSIKLQPENSFSLQCYYNDIIVCPDIL